MLQIERFLVRLVPPFGFPSHLPIFLDVLWILDISVQSLQKRLQLELVLQESLFQLCKIIALKQSFIH
jgi:hypothetical protein